MRVSMGFNLISNPDLTLFDALFVRALAVNGPKSVKSLKCNR